MVKRSIGLVLSVLSAVACAQTKLSGHVQDRSGTSLAGADVSVKMANNEVAHTSTDANGVFSFEGDAGTYDVSIALPKYVPMKSAMVTFAAGKPEPIILRPVGFMAGGGWEYGVLIQGGTGLVDRSDFKFLLAGVHLGKVLTPELGHGMLKGDFEAAVEVFPFWQSYTPTFQRIKCVPFPAGGVGAVLCSPPYTVGGTFTGVSVTPAIFRWNFTSGKKLMPWVQGAGGVIWTNHKYPAVGNTDFTDPTQTGPSADTSVWNFDPQFGAGVHYFVKPTRSVDFSANAVHISSASLGDKNPGVNTGVQFSVGYTWWK
jgi:lipid A 3-O-deacylase